MRIIKNEYGTFIEPDFKVVGKESCRNESVDWFEVCYRIAWCGVAGVSFGWIYDLLMGW